MARQREAELDLSAEVLDDSDVTDQMRGEGTAAAMAAHLSQLGWTVLPPTEKSWYATKVDDSKPAPTFIRLLAAYSARSAVNKATGGIAQSSGLTDEEVARAVGISTHTATARCAELNTLGLIRYVADEGGKKFRRNKYSVRTITDLGLAVLERQSPSQD